MIDPDIYVSVNFYPTDKNGRKLPTDPIFFGSIFVVNESKHDCRLLLNKVGSIAPGESKKNVPIKFLCPEPALPKLKEGTQFFLWDMRNIAEGEVEKVVLK